MTVYELFWAFFIYSFLGWCAEVIFQAFKTGRFINRGFLVGPVCPIYGCGVVAVVLLINPIREHVFQAYLVAVIVPTVIEYLTGFLAEKLLHMRLWDYSQMPLNINGYVCLLFSLIWGVACLLVYYFLYPLTMWLAGKLNPTLGWVLLAVFGAIFLTDLILTSVQALKIPRALRSAEEMERALRKISDSIGQGLADPALALREKELSRHRELDGSAEELAGKLTAQWQEFSSKVKAALEPYRKIFGKRHRIYSHLRKAFPHIEQTNEHKILVRASKLYRRLTEKEDSTQDGEHS